MLMTIYNIYIYIYIYTLYIYIYIYECVRFISYINNHLTLSTIIEMYYAIHFVPLKLL